MVDLFIICIYMVFLFGPPLLIIGLFEFLNDRFPQWELDRRLFALCGLDIDEFEDDDYED